MEGNLVAVIDKYMEDKVVGQKLRQAIRQSNIPIDKLDNDALVRILRDCGIYTRIMAEVEQIEQQNYQEVRDSDS